MALTAQLMASMDDGHLLASIEAELDPLTSTAIEQELTKRLANVLGERDRYRELTQAITDNDLSGLINFINSQE